MGIFPLTRTWTNIVKIGRCLSKCLGKVVTRCFLTRLLKEIVGTVFILQGTAPDPLIGFYRKLLSEILR